MLRSKIKTGRRSRAPGRRRPALVARSRDRPAETRRARRPPEARPHCASGIGGPGASAPPSDVAAPVAGDWRRALAPSTNSQWLCSKDHWPATRPCRPDDHQPMRCRGLVRGVPISYRAKRWPTATPSARSPQVTKIPSLRDCRFRTGGRRPMELGNLGIGAGNLDGTRTKWMLRWS